MHNVPHLCAGLVLGMRSSPLPLGRNSGDMGYRVGPRYGEEEG